MDPGIEQTCCAVCKLQTQRRCSRCLNIYYCNQDHQRQDWRRHKLECAPKLSKPKSANKKSSGRVIPTIEESNKKEQLASVLALNQQNKYQPSKDRGSEVKETERTIIKSDKKHSVKQDSVISGSKQSTKVSDENVENIKNVGDEEQAVESSSIQSSIPINVYINRGLSEHSAITEAGSSEDKILSEPAQQLSTMSYNIGNTQVSSRLDSNMPSLEQQTRLKEYPGSVMRPGPSTPLSSADSRVLEICRTLVTDMNEYGVCLLKNFYGKEKGLRVRNEVLNLYRSGIFTAGEVVSNPGSSRTQAIRSDLTTWVDGSEPYCTNIQQLMSYIDRIVITSNKMAGNGKLGEYEINGRTKAMVACYPGSGTHYVKHYDNPHKDGRCITAIYYLNLDWDAERNGGVLKVFPEGLDIECNVEPQFDNMLFFWSDLRNPHEVQPSYDTRYAVTLWYFDKKERAEARKRYSGMKI